MKIIEQIQTAGAWQAAIEGGFPTDLSSLGGVVTQVPGQMGQDLLANLTNGLDVLANVAASPDSIIGAVVAGIKAIVGAIKKSYAQRELNYSEARVGYLSEARGVRLASKLAGYQGCPNGYWNYPRASIAKDHCVPIWDPLGTPLNLPSWLVPYGWEKKGKTGNPWWPYDSKTPVGNSLEKTCYDWEDINLDTGDSDCDANAKATVIVAWPWAWPLCCPLRAAGSFLRYSNLDLEKIVAAQYMLPTPQHVLTSASDVAESKRIIKKAMLYWWPEAYEAAPGDWRNNGKPLQTQGYDPKTPASGTTFANYAAAMARIAGFERCRKAILADPTLIPIEVRNFYPLNPDFSKPAAQQLYLTPPKYIEPPGKGMAFGGDKLGGKPSGGGGGAIVVGGAAVAAYLLLRR